MQLQSHCTPSRGTSTLHHDCNTSAHRRHLLLHPIGGRISCGSILPPIGGLHLHGDYTDICRQPDDHTGSRVFWHQAYSNTLPTCLDADRVERYGWLLVFGLDLALGLTTGTGTRKGWCWVSPQDLVRQHPCRGGVKCISGLIYEETRGVHKIFLENVRFFHSSLLFYMTHCHSWLGSGLTLFSIWC